MGIIEIVFLVIAGYVGGVITTFVVVANNKKLARRLLED